ncbi:MAG: hypothetical protein ACLRLP_03320 [Lachnospira sp.]
MELGFVAVVPHFGSEKLDTLDSYHRQNKRIATARGSVVLPLPCGSQDV